MGVEAAHLGYLVDVGDVVMFSTKGPVGKVTRVFTSSDYDHLGIVYKVDAAKVWIVESVDVRGVCVTRFCVFTQWSHMYHRIAIRRLRGPPNLLRRVRRRLRDDMCGIVGAEFGMFRPKKYVEKLDSLSLADAKKQKSFFCSELVAWLFKRAGLLRPSMESCMYTPASFAVPRGMVLQKGFSLSDEELRVNFENQAELPR
jgi:hypothetical protein